MLVMVVAAVPVSATDPAWGIPPDGPAGPTLALSSIKATPLGSMVTTMPVRVLQVTCNSCESPTASADALVGDGVATLRVHFQNTWQATYNAKKQNFVPAAGQTVVVQGRLATDAAGLVLQAKRFSETAHAGPIVHAYELSAGTYPSGTYVWLAPVKVLGVAAWDDGDITLDTRDPAGGGLLYLEVSPPFRSSLRIPHVGELVQPYGRAHFDPDHKWWEMHPVRCWAAGECVQDAATFLQNGPPAGSPAAGQGGYLEGSAQPLWTPLVLPGDGGSDPPPAGSLVASFLPRNGNEWWIQVQAGADRALKGVDADVNGQGWTPLDHAWWGDWVKSVHAPTGSIVQFRATAMDGTIAQSPLFHWPNGTLATSATPPPAIAPPPPPPPPPPPGSDPGKPPKQPHKADWKVAGGSRA